MQFFAWNQLRCGRLGVSSVKVCVTEYISKPERPIKGRNKLSCLHDRQIREDKSAEQKTKPYQ